VDAVIPSRPSRLHRLKLAARRGVHIRGRVHVERGVRIAVARNARVVLEDGAVLGAGCRIEAAGGTVTIGAGARIGARAVLVSLAAIDIGPGAVVGEWAMVTDAEPTYDDPERPTRLQPLTARPITIGANARIGAHATIQTTVPPGTLVAPYETRAPRSPS
jgi:acetyltransferase-like isoleucine patch superfamily enzyme